MNTGNKQKIIHLSPSLYNRHSHSELSMHETGSILPEHKLVIGESAYETICKFYQASIDRQRELLETEEKDIIEAHIQAIVKLDSSKAVLAFALPSLDGIIFGSH